jgi:hypothetical protein
MTDSSNGAEDRLLTPAEVGALYRVDAKTASRWAAQQRFLPGTLVQTPGGHWRMRESLVLAQLAASESRS